MTTMSKKVIYKIDRQGNGKLVDMIGFGDTCVSAFAATQAKLGAAVGEPQYTEEYVKPVAADVQNNTN
jgi:hypothetical protein